MSGSIISYTVSSSALPIIDICSGTSLSSPYVVPQYHYVCITARVRNNGNTTEEYKLQLISPQGSIVDTEPDTYWINISPGQTKSISVSGNLLSAGLYNFSVRLKRCVCTSWTGCLTSCDSEPIDDIKNITVTTYEITSPPPPPSTIYYECVNGGCVQSYSVTPYTSLQACQNACTITPPPPTQSQSATHKFVISLSPLAWANYTGLRNNLPSIATTFANLMVGYGIFGIDILESKLENNDLIIYIKYIPTSSMYNTKTLFVLPAITGSISIGALIVAVLAFGFLIIAWRFENIIEAKTEVEKTIVDIAKENNDTLTNKYNKGEITYKEYIDGLKLINDQLKAAESKSGLCGMIGLTDQDCKYIKYGAITIGALIIIKVVSDLIPKSNK